MINFPEISPVAFQIGSLSVHWYGLMYLFSFSACWALLTLRLKSSSRGFSSEQLSDIIFYAAAGVIVGGRLGYVLFYGLPQFVHAPLRIFAIWEGGMSFHGGMLGVIIALWIYAKKIHRSLGEITDFIAPVVPLGLGAGRIGNFINGELWGRASDVPWAMVFPDGGPVPRHPSQLYEFFLEGVLLFCILWIFSRKERPRWAVSGLFLLLYGVCRFCVEYFREPDIQKGFVAFGWMTEGQLLSLPMIMVGILILIFSYRRKC